MAGFIQRISTQTKGDGIENAIRRSQIFATVNILGLLVSNRLVSRRVDGEAH